MRSELSSAIAAISPTAAERTSGPVEIDLSLLKHVAGGSPKGGWGALAMSSPKGGWAEPQAGSPKGGWQ